MPELLKRLAAISDPADRAAASTALLGASGDKLVETFRQSSQSFAQWFTDVQRYKDLTDAQKRSLQLFSETQGRLGVGFDRLGQQISATLARNLTPLMNKFAEFVENNTPKILAAVDDISQRFAAWLEKPETVAAFTAGVNSLLDALSFVVTHLDEIKVAAEAVAAVFVLKWATSAVLAVQALTNAIGLTGGAAIGTGLLGALASVAAIASVIALKGDTPGAGTPATPEQKKAGEDSAADINRRQGYTGRFGEDMSAWIKKGFDDALDRIMRGPANIRPGYQPQAATGGYLPGGVTPAAYQPGGGVATRQPLAFWLDMTRAISAGFQDAFEHLRDMGSAGAVGGVTSTPGVVPASYTPGDRPGYTPPGGAPRQAGGVAPPAAAGATGSLTAALGISSAQYDAFRGSISQIESGGRYGIMGGSSGRFAGKYQMGENEIRETAGRLGVPVPSREQFLGDPSMQEKFFENYTLDHHNWLMTHNAKYAAMSPADKAAALGYAHNQGAAGASKWINTGVAGSDAFNTSGTAYSKAIKDALGRTPAARSAPITRP